MKKMKYMIALMMMISMLIPSLSHAALPLRIVVNGERVLFPDAQPFIDKSNRTQVPLRFVSEALGAGVKWDNKTKTAIIMLDDKTITLVAGKKAYDINGTKYTMDTAALLKDKRTYVPLRFVGEGLGAVVKHEKEINTVYITTPEYGGIPVSEDIVIEDMYGFKVAKNTGSLLNIERGNYDEYGTKNKALITFVLSMSTIGADYEMQIQEVEDVIRQKIASKTADEIMAYIRKKSAREVELELKDFYDGTYHVRVGSPPYLGSVSVGIWYE